MTYAGGYCGCVKSSTTSTTTIKSCSRDLKTGYCVGDCKSGYECESTKQGCMCVKPKTTTTTIKPAKTTTTSTTIATATSTTIPYPCSNIVFPSEKACVRGYCPDGQECVFEETKSYSLCKCVDEIPYAMVDVDLPSTTTIMAMEMSLPDMDSDGIADIGDNCVNASNPGQEDSDGDGVGDACDLCVCESCGETTNPDFTYSYYDKYGCGCEDSDGGVKYYLKGTVARDEDHDGVNLSSQGGGPQPPTAPASAILESAVIIDTAVDPNLLIQQQTGMTSGLNLDLETSDYLPTYYTDYCYNYDNNVWDFYCDEEGVHQVGSRCEYGCVDGACVCEIADGNNPFIYGNMEGDYQDECINNQMLREHYYEIAGGGADCIHQTQTYDCMYGCMMGKCGCGDTDGGRNKTVKGTTVYGNTDYCIDDSTLMEYWVDAPCIEQSDDYTCHPPLACRDGACQSPSCLNGIQDGDETGVDCGGTWCPPCSPCATGARWAPTDGPCTQKWPTSQGPKIEGNTKSDSCELYEVCDENLDFIVEDALTCCENQDYYDKLSPPRFEGKNQSCAWARLKSGIDSDLNPGNFQKCLAHYAAASFGYGAVYMQGYFHGEWCCYGDGSICPDDCGKWRVNPRAWEMGSSLSCAGDGGSRPDFRMGGHRCVYNKVGLCSIHCTRWGEKGRWSSDTDYTSNIDSVVDVPAHASILRLSTGTCVDYSVAMTTILRKLGFGRDSVYSVDGDGHWYNLIRFPGEVKWHYLDTTGNRGSEIMGGAGYNEIINWSHHQNKAYGYDYCRKMDDGCSNDHHSESLGRCPINDMIYGCEGIPR